MNASPENISIEHLVSLALDDDSLELPPPPDVASEVMRLTGGDAVDDDDVNASAAELAGLIQRDIALAGQVMRVANSALYARRTPVVSLPQAIAWLGIREVRNIAFSVALQAKVFTSSSFPREMTDLWRESVVTALFAQEIARLKRRNVESAYLCGLMHRVGMAVLLNRTGAIARRYGIVPDAGQLLEVAAMHESNLGRQLSIAWTLPLSVATAVAHWRDPSQCGTARTEVMEVALARHISAELRTPGIGGELPATLLGPVSEWMDELSIYPDELFSIMANRAAICATAESFT